MNNIYNTLGENVSELFRALHQEIEGPKITCLGDAIEVLRDMLDEVNLRIKNYNKTRGSSVKIISEVLGIKTDTIEELFDIEDEKLALEKRALEVVLDVLQKLPVEEKTKLL